MLAIRRLRKDHWQVRVADKTDLFTAGMKCTVSLRDGQHVVPPFRLMGRGVDKTQVLARGLHFELRDDGKGTIGELVLCPSHGSLGDEIEQLSIDLAKGCVFMISEEPNIAARVNQFEARQRITSVPDDITQTADLVYLLLIDIGKDSLERFEVGMDIRYNGKPHLLVPSINR
jgi:hypothetical protein